MTYSSNQARVRLSKLRDIGWELWDPIGLLGPNGVFPGKWEDDANRQIADEYDRYLISAASQLQTGVSRAQVIDYLVEIEAKHMGLGIGLNTRARAKAAVDAIIADKAIWT